MAAHGDTFNISNPPELHSTNHKPVFLGNVTAAGLLHLTGILAKKNILLYFRPYYKIVCARGLSAADVFRQRSYNTVMTERALCMSRKPYYK